MIMLGTWWLADYQENNYEGFLHQVGDVKKHIQSVHEKVRYPCDECGKQFTVQASLKKHLQSVHEGVKYPCSHCDYRSSTQGSLKRHLQKTH